jgi:hypothetical protein
MEPGSMVDEPLPILSKNRSPTMAGNYLNNIIEHESRIRSWMVAVTKDGGIDRYDDLHLDRIERSWKDPKAWIPAGLHAFDLALKIRDQEQLCLSVVLGFSLKSAIEPQGFKFRVVADIEDEFAATPPSLYVFRPGQEPWIRAGRGSENQDVVVQKIDPAVFRMPLRIKACLYFEFTSGTEEYYRSILFAG